MKLLSIQPFGLTESSGGAKILSKLFLPHSAKVISICCSNTESTPPENLTQIFLRQRINVPRLESTRLGPFLWILSYLRKNKGIKKLEQICRDENISAIHTVPHDLSFTWACELVRRTSLPLYLSLHDDIRYTMSNYPYPNNVEKDLKWAWNKADARFVISEALGEEYSKRYGEQDWLCVTNGVSEIADSSRAQVITNKAKIYFAGLFHYNYLENLKTLLSASKAISQISFDFTFRCKCLPSVFSEEEITVEPFAEEEIVYKEMEDADILYFPLPLTEDGKALGQFSLSTKLITYLSSGVPILYHGPKDTYAAKLLRKEGAALMWTDNSPETLAQLLTDSGALEKVSTAGLALAKKKFLLEEQRRKFWSEVTKS